PAPVGARRALRRAVAGPREQLRVRAARADRTVGPPVVRPEPLDRDAELGPGLPRRQIGSHLLITAEHGGVQPVPADAQAAGEQHRVTVRWHKRTARHHPVAPVTEELDEGPDRLGHVHGIGPFWFPAPERDRWRGHDHKRASEPFPVASANVVRSGSGNRRADSSRGRADETDLHLSTVSPARRAAKGICLPGYGDPGTSACSSAWTPTARAASQAMASNEETLEPSGFQTVTSRSDGAGSGTVIASGLSLRPPPR